jgi:hypothetical protein
VNLTCGRQPGVALLPSLCHRLGCLTWLPLLPVARQSSPWLYRPAIKTKGTPIMKKLSLVTAFAITGAATFAAAVAWVSAAHADGSSTPYGHGGMIFPQMNSIIAQYNKSGELFRIEGECRSSCTELLAIKHVCIDPNATVEFHAALRTPSEPVDPGKNRRMASYYNPGLRNFVLANHYMDSWEFHTISGQEMIQKFGYRPCPDR